MLLWLRTAMVTSVPTVKLNDGRSHPVVGYGTYKVSL